MDEAIVDAIDEVLDAMIKGKERWIGARRLPDDAFFLVLSEIAMFYEEPFIQSIVNEIHFNSDDTANAELNTLLMQHMNEAPRLDVEQQVRVRELLAGVIWPMIEAEGLLELREDEGEGRSEE